MNSKVWRLAASFAAVCGALVGTNAWAALSMDVLSSRPELVSNASALVVIKGATAIPTVMVDTRDVSKQFSADPSTPGQYLGLIDGLTDGKNTIQATAGADKATLTVTNHPVNKQLFSGPLQSPFVCELDSLGLKAAPTANLDPARNPDCAAPAVVSYFYKNKGGEWKAFDTANRPGDVATVKMDGKDVPLIIRQEKGVINRSGYVFSILHDPAAGPAPTFLAKGGSAWNGKLIYSYGPGAKAGFHQGRGFGGLAPATAFVEDAQVGAFNSWITRGYAIASGSLNQFGTSTDDVVSAETTYKIKEQFIKEYGPPIYTLGSGVSGGSMQQQLIANAYPGILDGIIPHQEFADAMTFSQPLFDCELLANVFKTGTWTRAQMDAVSGMFWGYCVSNGVRYPGERPDNCDAVVLTAVAADPALKAAGVRCTYQDNMLHTFGIDPATGFARSPWDNVGIQYGLTALNNGTITWDQFLDINQRVGGLDAGGKITANRQVGDATALQIAYQTGRVNEETGGLAAIPQIATRAYIDGDPFGRGDANVDVHASFHTKVVQARLQKYLGTTGTMVYFEVANAVGNYDTATVGSPLNIAYLDALNGMDKWLMAIKADTSAKTPTQKVVDDKPKDLVDACYPTKEGYFVTGIEKLTDQAKCAQIFPSTTDPRIAAGGPMTDDVFKCQLKPVDAAGYKAAPSAAQLAQLKTIFPAGVCDYTKPGVGQTQKITTWAVFSDAGVFAGL